MKKCYRNMMAALVLTSALCAGANAQVIENNTNVYVGVLDYFFDSERNQEDDMGFLLGGEMPISERWSLGLEYWQVDSDLENTLDESELAYTRIAGNYHLNHINKWQPYLSAGLGNFKLENNTPGASANETNMDFGIGVKRRLNESFLFRSDVKTILGFDSGTVDFAVSVGIGYVFGGKTAKPEKTAVVPAVILAPEPIDTDGDGVFDNTDSCRNTPVGASVDGRGCEVDTDRDGVVDSRDDCPATPEDLRVDSKGCPILEKHLETQTLAVKFDTNKAVVKPAYAEELKAFADFMRVYSNTDVVIEGHTDSDGSEALNQALSERRATAVMTELVNVYGIDSRRLTAVGYGETMPVATNSTSAGKRQNRRIDAVLSVEVEEQQKR